ncbi:hypothetical protein JCM11641_002577 [Rhodosporidiobolus odoratus]
MSKAPSRQNHACGVVYSRAEYAPKLDCPECQSTFTRQDLLLRHIKVFHPSRDTPSPSELAEQLDLPPPLPIHQNSIDSVSSFNSSASASASSLLGGPIASSPELLGHSSFTGELPIPPLPSTSARRTATYPLPLSSAPGAVSHQPVPYTPYAIPNFSLPPSSYVSPSASPAPPLSASTSSSFMHLPLFPTAGVTRSASGRSYTMPAPFPSLVTPHGATSIYPPPPLPLPLQPPAHRPNFVDASVQTDLLALHIPPHLLPTNQQYHTGGSTPVPGPLAVPPPIPLSHQMSHSHSHQQQHHQDQHSQQNQQQQHQHQMNGAGGGDEALAAFLQQLRPEPSPFSLDVDYNPFHFGVSPDGAGSNGIVSSIAGGADGGDERMSQS